LRTSGLSADSPTTDDRKTVFTALSKNVLTRDSLAGIIERQGLYPRERANKGMGGVVERMVRDIKLDPVDYSNNLVHVAFVAGNDAEQARRVETELIDKLLAAERPGGYTLEVRDPPSLPKRSSPDPYLILFTGFSAGYLLSQIASRMAQNRVPTAPAGNSPILS
jgi:hypothetical protein